MASAARHADALRVDDLRWFDVVSATAKQFARGHSELVSGRIQRLDDPCDVVAFQICVVVAEKNELAARFSQCLIDCSGESAILFVDDLHAVRKSSAHLLNGVIVRRVVDVNQFDIRMRLLRDSGQTAAQVGSIVPGD